MLARMRATRTATAVGTIVNDGNVTTEFRLRLFLQRHQYIGTFDPGPVLATVTKTLTQQTLPPGGSSPATLSESMLLEPGETLTAIVHLDRISPEPANQIASSGAAAFQEPITLVAGGSLSGFTPTLELNFRLAAPRAGQRQLGRARR